MSWVSTTTKIIFQDGIYYIEQHTKDTNLTMNYNDIHLIQVILLIYYHTSNILPTKQTIHQLRFLYI